MNNKMMFLPTFGFFPNLGIFWYATLRFKKKYSLATLQRIKK